MWWILVSVALKMWSVSWWMLNLTNFHRALVSIFPCTQVSILPLFPEHFFSQDTLRMQAALPRTAVNEHCTKVKTEEIHWVNGQNKSEFQKYRSSERYPVSAYSRNKTVNRQLTHSQLVCLFYVEISPLLMEMEESHTHKFHFGNRNDLGTAFAWH